MSFLKSIWKGNSKHKKLYDEWALASTNENESMAENPSEEATFLVKYLGSTLVEKPSSEEATAEAVKTVLTMAKAGGRKLQVVSLSVSLSGIKMVDVSTEETHLEVSVYRISYCSADAANSRVFAFIATNENETMECHAFLCRKRKMAQTMSLTVARAFKTAYELWQLSQDTFALPDNGKKEADFQNYINDHSNEQSDHVESPRLLIDFHAEPNHNRLGAWESFDEDLTDNLNYTQLTEVQERMQTPTMGANNLQSFFGNSNFNYSCWEDSRTNLLCS